ncbi:phosphotransferase [Kitasatospora sp. NPDC059673]|uniref:phosphotransferase n=1 Tax=Kitasatospora sp. NPDC059673 TaxID=3346901 RepID=UPI0036A39BD0
MEIGELIASGRTADVWALNDGRVLRRYRDGLTADGEAEMMAHLAEHGYPVPAVWPADRPEDLIMERLGGPTMLESLLAGTISPGAAGELLAGLLRRLHQIPPRAAARPGDRMLHLDLHPDNVLLTAHGPVVIDWSTAAEGEPGLDDAMSAVILAQALHDRPDTARTILVPLLRGLPPIADRHLAEARARRAANPTLSAAEIAVLDSALALISSCAKGS